MSKLNCIDKKRRLNSFLIYIFVAACLLCGCATGSSVEMDSAADVDSRSDIDQGDTGMPSSDTVPEEKLIAEVAEKKADTRSVESAVIVKDVKEKEYTESEPRIFFKPSASKLGQILGIDFSPLPMSRSSRSLPGAKSCRSMWQRREKAPYCRHLRHILWSERAALRTRGIDRRRGVPRLWCHTREGGELRAIP